MSKLPKPLRGKFHANNATYFPKGQPYEYEDEIVQNCDVQPDNMEGVYHHTTWPYEDIKRELDRQVKSASAANMIEAHLGAYSASTILNWR